MPNYDVIEDTASYHGTKIATGVPSKAYQDGWDRIFGKKEQTQDESKQEEVKMLQK